jgi:hypothetical protein
MISAVRSRSCGTDLKGPRSNLGRSLEIGWIRCFARGSGDGESLGLRFHGSARLGLAGALALGGLVAWIQLGFGRGASALQGELVQGTRRHVGALAWRAAMQGGAASRGSLAGGVLGVDVGYGPRYPAQKKGGADVMLTEY